MPETVEQTAEILGSAAEPEQWYAPENAELVQRCGWTDANGALKSYRDLEVNASGKVKMPTPESSAEEIRAFYQKSGCPENPEGYEVSGLPEAMPEFLRNEDTEKALSQIAYDQGISKQAFETIVRGFYEKTDADFRTANLQGEQTLKEQHGDKYDEVVNVANRFFDSCSPEFCELVKATGLASHPVFINEFNSKGKQTMADTLVRGDGGGGAPPDPNYKPSHPNSPEQYAYGETEEDAKARAYFTAKGHVY